MARRLGLGIGISKERRDVNTLEGVAPQAFNVLTAEGVAVDYGCLVNTGLKIYNPADTSPNRLYPIAYEILNANGVNVAVECLSETTKNLINE